MTLPFLEMMNSSAFKGKICRPQFIQTLSQMISQSEVAAGTKNS